MGVGGKNKVNNSATVSVGRKKEKENVQIIMSCTDYFNTESDCTVTTICM